MAVEKKNKEKELKKETNKISQIFLFPIFFSFLFLPSPLFCEEYGLASWYGGGEPLNTYTASGERFSPYKLTCATRKYPIGTLLRITNLSNGKSVVVRVNDRGPAEYLPFRIVDLTKYAFSKIADLKRGLVYVKVEVVETPGEENQTELVYNFTEEINRAVKEEISQMFQEVKKQMQLITLEGGEIGNERNRGTSERTRDTQNNKQPEK